MHTLVVADSAYGNTWALAEAITAALGSDSRLLRPDKAPAGALEGVQLLVVGSPTQGGRPLPSVTEWVRALPMDALDGKAVAAFDTRIAGAERALPLRLLMKVIGYAAPKLATALVMRGGRQVVPPEGFFVDDKEGPLKPGEAERAAAWARSLLTSAEG